MTYQGLKVKREVESKMIPSYLLVKSNKNIDLIVPAAEIELAKERSSLSKDKIKLINAGEVIESNGFKFHAIPSAHEKIKKDENGNHYYLGYIVEFGPWTIYHSGDTVEYDQMEKYLTQWDLDVVFLPINGRKSERRAFIPITKTFNRTTNRI